MNVTLYSDAECKTVFKSGYVGEWSHILGNTGSTGSSTSNTADHTVEGETVTFRQLCYFNESTVSNATHTPTDIVLNITTSNTVQTLYFTTKACLKVYCYKSGTITEFYCDGFYQDYGNGFVKVTNIPSPHIQSYNNKPIILRFRYSANGYYKSSSGGSEHKYPQEGFFGFDVVSYNNQGSAVVDRCRYAVAPYDKYMVWGDIPDYKPPKGNRRGGGKGTGYYPNSTIPALPTSAINAAFSSVLGRGNGLTYYVLTGDALENLTEFLYDCGLTAKFRNSEYRDAVASVIFVPVNVVPDVTNTKNIIHLANKAITVDNGTCNIVTQPLVEFDFGVIDLSANNIGYKNFADIAYTSATLYLPCFGCVNIDMSSVAGGLIYLRGVVDVRNGNILYRVETQSEMDKNPVLYGQYNGNCGIPIPIGGANAQKDILGAVTSIGAIGVGLATGNPVAALVGAGGLISSAPPPSIDHSGAMQPAAAVYGTTVPILQVRKHLVNPPPKYKEMWGIPSDGSNDGEYDDMKYTLRDFTGYFEAAHCDVTGISGATDDEKAEIENLLLEGVWI